MSPQGSAPVADPRDRARFRAETDALLATLDGLDGLLGERRFPAGDRVTEADRRLLTTPVRFDAAYALHHLAHGAINPTGIVPRGPDTDFAQPHGRG